MIIPSNRVYGIAMTGFVLITLTLLCGAALSEAHDRPAQPAVPHASMDAKTLPGFDPAKIQVAERNGAVHVRLEPGSANMHLTVVDSALATKPVRVQAPPPRRAAHLE